MVGVGLYALELAAINGLGPFRGSTDSGTGYFSPVFPSKLFFFCEVEPGKGGETCIALSHVIYERMEQKHPKFVKEMEEKGFIYTRVLGDESDHSSPVGRSWKEVFMTDDKTIAEERAAKLGMKLEWMEGAVKAIIGPNPGFRYDEVKKHKIWFNGVVGRFEDKLNNDPANAVVFSDGKPLPADVSDDCAKIFDEECVALQWRKGDVLLLDNLAVVHSRRPLITLPRRVLASFCK
ncbi:putative TauD/TfdA-like domain, taurine dioxygenase TauD-like superfamily [Helianthus annuus]|nr:putative TauD/TfdA-like domain, taurine dioxygenase TauD-like superfamily [Helianthus annuus]KAJ0713464.1 putative TauD/TfdA-like domain, taurine dioxygenase TauD-like superfamily [Helianthus annuus]